MSCWLQRSLRILIAVALACVPLLSQAPTPDDRPVALRIIVLGTRDEAEQVRAQLESGANFLQLARRLSIDPSAAGGGAIGSMPPSAMRPELREAIRGVEPGHLTGVVPLPTGYAVVMVMGEGAAGAGVFSTALSAEGAIRYLASLDGFTEANTVLESFAKPDDWNQDPQNICRVRRESLAASHASLGRALDPANLAGAAGLPLSDVMQARQALGQLLAYDGRLDEAIAQFEEAGRLAASVQPAALADIEESLGVLHLHRAEQQNGVFHAPGERCLFPRRPGQTLARTGDVEQAIALFEKRLRQSPDDRELRWLLNLAYSAIGGYPARVPPAFLIPPERFASAEDVGRFTDVAAAAGFEHVASAGGVIVDDFDNDGRLDVVASNFDSCGAMHYFRRGADGRFADGAQAAAGLASQPGGLNLVQADYDNDGCRDILVLRGGWDSPQRRSLLRNRCDGTFTDVTVAAGLALPVTSSQTAVWTDVDNDGFVNLFVGNEDSAAQLFRNRRDGTFENVARRAGVDRIAFTKGVTAGDYDNDGYQDLYVSNHGGGNFLYHNERNGTFTERAAAAGVATTDRGFATWFFDYDNDGDEDLFVTTYYLSIAEVAHTYAGERNNAPGMKLYRNNGDGTFTNVAAEVGLARVFMTMGANFGDIDNDGFLDIYLGTGAPSYAAIDPSVLLRNREGRRFVDVTASSGTGELHKGHGIAFADLDRDGDEDIVAEVGGATPGDAHAFRLFRNPGHGNDWLGLSLVGVASNRAAIGARLTVTVEESGGRRRVMHRTVRSGGSFGASPLEQHVGLGANVRSVSVDVFWPASNSRQHFGGVPRNRVIEIREQAGRFTLLERPALPLGPAGAEVPRAR